MKVINHTPFPVHVQRECFEDAFAVVDATTKVSYDSRDGATWRYAIEQLPVHVDGCPDAPLGEIRYMRDEAVVEVSVVGDVVQGASGFRSRELRLTVGDHERRLRIFGPRRWERDGHRIRASEPESADRVPMIWDLAYGGVIARPPGFLPGTRTPAPSTEIPWAANPAGQGFVFEEEGALGATLPQIEDPMALVLEWFDRPAPRCWAPMPANTSLRMDHLELADGRFRNRHGEHELMLARAQLNAPPELQFVDVRVGTQVCAEGFDPVAPLRFDIPAAGFCWWVRSGSREHRVVPHLAAIQLRPNERRVTCLYRTRLYAPLVRRELREATQEPTSSGDFGAREADLSGSQP